MASFGVDIWDPRNVGSHSTDEKSRDQWVNKGGGKCMRGSGMCMNKNKLLQR